MNVNPIIPVNGRLLAANGGEARSDAMRQALIAGWAVMQTVRHVELAVLRQKRADAALRIQVDHRHRVAIADLQHRSHIGVLRQAQMVGLVACRNILLVLAARLARRHKHQLCLRRARRDGADQVVERTVELVHVRAAQLSQRHVTAKVVNAAKDDADICRVIDAVQALDKRIATVGLDGNTRTLNTKVLDRSAAQQRTQVRSPGDIVASPAAAAFFLQAKAAQRPLPDGRLTLCVEGGQPFALTLENGRADAVPCDAADYQLTHAEAMALLFSPEGLLLPQPAAPAGWLPLPVYVDSPDKC